MKPVLPTRPAPVKTATKTVGDYVIEWLFDAAKRAAENERRKRLLSSTEIDRSQKEVTERIREKNWPYC